MATYYGPLTFHDSTDTSTVVDPRFGVGALPTQPAGWGDSGGGTVSGNTAVIDVATELGTTLAHIQSAIDTASNNAAARNGGPTTVFLDARDWTVNGVIYMKSGVTLAGAGREQTILKKSGDGPCIAGGSEGNTIYSATRPTITCTRTVVQDLWIDCANQSTGSVGSHSAKGIYYVDVSRSAVRRVKITDTQASALGWDYPSDHSIVEDCIVINPGRMGKGDGIGGNAYGTMSGGLAEEDFVITNCTAIDARAAVVVEVWKDMTNNGHGPRVDNCIAIDCIYGFENAGVPAATFDSCVSIRAKEAGFKFGRGDHSGNDLATGYATMNNCFAIDGLIDGVNAYFNTPAAARFPSLVIQNSVLAGNDGYGVRVTMDTYDVQNFTVRGNTIRDNTLGGFASGALSTGQLVDLSLVGNDFHGNGGSAVRFNSDLTRGRVEGNSISGGTKGVELVTGRTMTGTSFDGGRIDSTTPVDLAGTITDCHVGHVPGWTRRAGVPTVKAPKGTVYQRTDGTAGTLLYVNTDGGTTWTAYA